MSNIEPLLLDQAPFWTLQATAICFMLQANLLPKKFQAEQ